jgi:hypothetical protein
MDRSSGVSGERLRLTSHFLMPRLGMSGVLPLLHPYNFLAFTGTTLIFAATFSAM